MDIVKIEITKEITSELYYKLIDFAVGKFPFFVFVIDWERRVDESAKEVVEELSPFLVKKFYSSEWPGTQIYKKKVEVFHYYLTEDSANILKKHTSSFYQWRLWELPEDLSIMRNAEQPWLCNIAYHKLLILYVSPKEKAELLNAIPEISEYLGKESKPTWYYT